MPQMAPMSWIMLFIFFSLMLITFNVMNYYLYTPHIKNMYDVSKTKKKMSWMW
uniref:ATP synthase complex subunit 8 n=1 Tax=Brachythemis contaminata TaxID=342759 RepID=A0A0U1YSS0_BRACT|nr:ATP synthase F0 subunit 8 [Brachythemis contaminata]AJE75779.1 ATP synthase F0 subunit 8 [Brachythemis contaminata]